MTKKVTAWCVKSPDEGLIYWTVRTNKEVCKGYLVERTNVSWSEFYGYKVVPVTITEIVE